MMACCPMRSPMEVGARAGRRGALLRSCPPASPCGRPLLLYFAAQSAPPARSGHAAGVFDDGTPPPSPDKDVGWPTERSKGGGGGRQADAGGHERSRPPNVLVCRATREGMTAMGSKPTFAKVSFQEQVPVWGEIRIQRQQRAADGARI